MRPFIYKNDNHATLNHETKCTSRYCQKDHKIGTYRFVRHNVDNEALTAGRIAYAACNLQYTDGKRIIDKGGQGIDRVDD